MGRESRGFNRGGRGNRSGGRGRFQYSNNNARPPSNASLPKELKFAPHTQGKIQYATYATVKEAVVQYIQKTFKGGHDVAKSLKDGKVVDLTLHEPDPELSMENDATKAAIEQAGMDIKYQEQLRRHLDRVDNLNQGLTKAYALIFSTYCVKTMQSRIEEHPDFERLIEDDPIVLLEIIKTLMHDPVRAQYPFVGMVDSLARMINIQQLENEMLLDWVKRFKQTRDVMKGYWGAKICDDYIEQSEAYKNETDTAAKAKMKTDAFDQLMAYLLIRGSDQRKYGTLQKVFVSQLSLGNDQYPKTI
jgi:hypothetical protein